MKKLVAAVLCVCILIGALPLSVSASEKFQDVSEKSWYADTVAYVVSKGLMQGTGKLRFEPETIMSRAMFVQVLSNRAKNFDKEKYLLPSCTRFEDINIRDWFYASVRWAADNMITDGTSPEKFSPNQALTREQAVKLLYFYAIRCGEDTSVKGSLYDTFADTGKVSDWAKIPMQWAVGNGVIQGVGQNRLDPKGKLTRAQAAQLFRNLDKKMKYTDPLYSETGAELTSVIPSYLDFTFEELSKNTPNPGRLENGYSGSWVYQFNNYPDIYFLFPAVEHNKITDLPEKNAKPTAILAATKTIIPDICGLSYGEAVRKLNGALHISYPTMGTIYNAFVGRLLTENYNYFFSFYVKATVEESSYVVISTHDL